MRLEPLYRATFTTPESWHVEVPGGQGPGGRGADGTDEQGFLIAEGRTDGRISGRLRASNWPRRRASGTQTPDFRGVIECDDGATVLFAWQGYGRAGVDGGPRQLVGSLTHLSGDARYAGLNDEVCAVAGEIHAGEGGGFTVVLDVMQLVWEPLDRHTA